MDIFLIAIIHAINSWWLQSISHFRVDRTDYSIGDLVGSNLFDIDYRLFMSTLSRSFTFTYIINFSKKKIIKKFICFSFTLTLIKKQVNYFLFCSTHLYMSRWPFQKNFNYTILHAMTCWEWPVYLTFKVREDKVFAWPTGIIWGDKEENPQPVRDMDFLEASSEHTFATCPMSTHLFSPKKPLRCILCKFNFLSFSRFRVYKNKSRPYFTKSLSSFELNLCSKHLCPI